MKKFSFIFRAFDLQRFVHSGRGVFGSSVSTFRILKSTVVTPSFGRPVAGYIRPAIFSPAIDLILFSVDIHEYF